MAVRRGETEVWSVEAHEPRAQCVAWLPNETVVSCGADNMIKTWKDGQAVAEYGGHGARVNRVVPTVDGKLLSSSFDGTWRFWDLEHGKELAAQEGHHQGSVYGLASHPDGALAATGGLDALVRLWDLRSGKCFT